MTAPRESARTPVGAVTALVVGLGLITLVFVPSWPPDRPDAHEHVLSACETPGEVSPPETADAIKEHPSPSANSVHSTGSIRSGKQPSDAAESEVPAPSAEIPPGQNFVRPRQVATSAPLSPWNTIESEYKRRAADESQPLATRSDAASKVRFRFAEWRGRGNNRLGGFEFDLEKMALLDGWEGTRTSVSVHSLTAPPVHVEQIIDLQKDQAGIFIRIQVAMSAGWAQQLMLNRQRSASSGMAHTSWGDLHGIEIGDVWFGDHRLAQRREVTSGAFDFTRRNVYVQVQFDNASESTNSFSLDLFRLAREIDAQIKEQGLPGQDWGDVAQHCPQITEFHTDEPALKSEQNFRSTFRFEVQSNPKVEISVFASGEPPLFVDLDGDPPYAELAYIDPNNLDAWPKQFRCWLVAVNERNLLFSVAELTFTLERR